MCIRDSAQGVAGQAGGESLHRLSLPERASQPPPGERGDRRDAAARRGGAALGTRPLPARVPGAARCAAGGRLPGERPADRAGPAGRGALRRERPGGRRRSPVRMAGGAGSGRTGRGAHHAGGRGSRAGAAPTSSPAVAEPGGRARIPPAAHRPAAARRDRGAPRCRHPPAALLRLRRRRLPVGLRGGPRRDRSPPRRRRRRRREGGQEPLLPASPEDVYKRQAQGG